MTFLKFIRNIFSSDAKKQIREDVSEYLFIHEDDAGQIELLPSENLHYLKEEAEKITMFSDQHFDGTGWTEVYIRKEPPVELLHRNIVEDNFKNHFYEQGYRSREVRYSGMKSVPVSEFAFEKDGFLFYYSIKAGLVNSIYFSQHFTNQQLFVETVLFLSQTYSLILADWWKLMVFDTSQEDEIQRYLREK